LPNVFHAAREIFARAGWSVMVVDDDPAFIAYPLQGSRQTLKVDLSLSEIAVRQHESPVLASGLLDLPVRQMHLLPLELVLAVDEIHAYQALRVFIEKLSDIAPGHVQVNRIGGPVEAFGIGQLEHHFDSS